MKVTELDREKFQIYIKKWQDLLGLFRWRLVLTPKKTKMMAEVEFDSDPSCRLAKLKLGSDWGNTPVDEETLEMTALHEVLHVLFKDFKDVCTTKPHDEDAQMWHEHEIVHVLEKLLYELDKGVIHGLQEEGRR